MMMNDENMSVEPGGERETFAVGIVGTNIVAKTLEYAFTKPYNEIMVVDDINKHVEDLAEWQPNIVFVCTEVNIDDDGLVEASELEANVSRILLTTEAGVVIKTSMSIDLVDRICGANPRAIYSPDIATQTDCIEERITPGVQIIGGAPNSTTSLQEIYYRFSTFNIQHFAHVTPVEAAFIESSISSFATIKSVFFNELYDAVSSFGGDYHTISTFISTDPNVGAGETRVPGLDLKRGCNRKAVRDSTKMLTRFDERFTLLQKAKEINETYVNRED